MRPASEITLSLTLSLRKFLAVLPRCGVGFLAAMR
jgi:hypothetical protein